MIPLQHTLQREVARQTQAGSNSQQRLDIIHGYAVGVYNI